MAGTEGKPPRGKSGAGRRAKPKAELAAEVALGGAPGPGWCPAGGQWYPPGTTTDDNGVKKVCNNGNWDPA